MLQPLTFIFGPFRFGNTGLKFQEVKIAVVTTLHVVSLKAVPFEVSGQAGRGEGRCSGGETHHSASGSVLQREVHEEKTSHRVVCSR